MPKTGRVKCFTAMGGPPRFEGQRALEASPQIRGRLQLLRSHFSKALQSQVGAGRGVHIRGHSIAPDSILQALLENGTCIDLAFVSEATMVPTLNDWARSAHYAVEVYSTSQLLEFGLDAFALDLWLDLTNKCDGAIRIRDRRSRRAFPIVSLQHGVSNEKYLYDVFARLLMSPTYSCDSIICTSNSCKETVSSIFEYISETLHRDFGARVKFNGRLDVLPLCVDTNLLVPLDKQASRKRLGIPGRSTVILYVGYLSLTKADMVQVLPTLRSLIDNNPASDIQIILAGTGPNSYITYLKNAIKDLELSSRITVHLGITDETKHLLLSSADIFFALCESFQESFGLTPVEAMSCGLPQVVAAWDGYRETVLHGETGFLFPQYGQNATTA